MRRAKVTAMEEKAMFEQYAQTKDIAIRNEIVCNNAWIVEFTAKKFLFEGVEKADLLNEGNIGLIHAVEKFDCTLGYEFSTYAVYWVKHYMMQYIANNCYTFRLPSKAHDDIVKLKKAKSEFEDKHGRTPSVDELAEKAELTSYNVNLYMSASTKPASLNQTYCDDADFGDIIPDDSPLLEDAFELDDRDKMLHEAVKTFLTDRERYVITHLFGLAGPDRMTLADIGSELGITSQAVHKIKDKALLKLKDGLEKWGYGRGYAA